MQADSCPASIMILVELNRRLCAKLWNAIPGQWERIGSHGDYRLRPGAYGQPVRGHVLLA